jgi:hypothetical protein
VQLLLERGFQDAKEMKGGFSAWQQRGYSVISAPTPPTPAPTLEPTPSPTPTPTPTVVPTEPPLGHFRLPTRGLYVQIEQRGSTSMYWNGQLIKEFNNFDPVVSTTVAKEAELQLEVMRSMGINTITFELRATDNEYIPGPYVPPECNIGPGLGLLWPQPTEVELTNLRAFFDLVHNKGMRIFLRLVNTHMEEQPPTNSETWLRAILQVVKDYPALDLILFEGDTHLVDTDGDEIPDSCGVQAEPPLWMGPTSLGAKYVKWAISFAQSLGIPAPKLSAEAIVGAFFVDSQPGNSFATDGHLWSPIVTLKRIFDDLGIPDNQRTYAVSFYEHHKCSNAGDLPCVDADPHNWAEETLQRLFATIGDGNGARVVAPEMGYLPPVDPTRSTELVLESLVFLMEKYGVDGGAFWRWTSFYDDEDRDASLAEPVKRRGTEFTYNPVYKEILDMGGFHLTAIPNGSFEAGSTTPDNWTVTGNGIVLRYHLASEAGQPETPWRGEYMLRLTTGPSTDDTVSTSSELIAVTPNTTYTTVANLRFGWAGDSNLGNEPSKRPQVFVSFQYFDKSGLPSSIRAQDSFRFYQEDASQGFGTFPFQYTTPNDARFVRIEVGAARNGLPTPITLDVDYLR